MLQTNNSLHISSNATNNEDYLKTCAPQVQCDQNAKYRSINGSCNNLEIPTWGASKTPFFRLLNANFSDGEKQYYYETANQNMKLVINNNELDLLKKIYFQFVMHTITSITVFNNLIFGI